MSFDNIPQEMRAFNQWINWRYEQVKTAGGDASWTKIPIRPIDGRNASVTNPRDWTDYNTAVEAALRSGFGIGFVFTKSDPFAGIDLDNSEGDMNAHNRQCQIYQTINSYAEFSPSGRGLHIIAKATLPGMGRRRGKIECYDNQRFFTVTGNVYNGAAIRECQDEVTELWESLGHEITITNYNGYDAETYSDAEVIERAMRAENGSKFRQLWEGDWQSMGEYPSQSEADQALINFLGFYSRNATQISRIFRQSALGCRVKAERGKYVMDTVRKAFDKMLPQVSIPTATDTGTWFDASEIEPWSPKLTLAKLGPLTSAVWASPASVSAPIALARPGPSLAPASDAEFAEPTQPMPIPGLMGDLVAHTWQMAVHQIPEAALASAISTMSLLCSRSYRHGSMGLSVYLMLLAQTSTGKSFAYQANDARFNAMIAHYRGLPPPHSQAGKLRADILSNMVIGEIGSAQGLAQHMPDAPSTLAHLDEYVDHIRMMASPNPPPHLAQIRSELLKLMEMSGPGRVYRGRKYSKRGTSTEQVDVLSASLSILATGTPEQFYNELSATLLTSGFLPRFTILEYSGELPRRNRNPITTVPKELEQRLIVLSDKAFNMAGTLVGKPTEFVNVQPNKAADEYLEWFDVYCLKNVNKSNQHETNMAGIWSRAKDNVRKIASLIAIGVNPHMPVIEYEHVKIAISIVMPTIDKIERRIASGETGNGDDRLEAEFRRIIQRMIAGGWEKFKGYPAIKQELIDNGMYQISAIRNQCIHLSAFKTHRFGSSRAFENVLDAMMKYGFVRMVEANGVKCIKPDMHYFKR